MSGHQVGSHRIRNLAKGRPIRCPGIASEPGDNHLWLVSQREFSNLVVIQQIGCGVNAVRDDIVVAARTVGLAAVSQVTAMH
jgi:hypothetical protein